MIVRDDPELSARTPAERPARVKVEFHDGRVLEESLHLPLGEFDMKPVSDDALGEKFLKLASTSLGSDTATTLLDGLWHVESAPDIQRITSLCGGASV